MVSLHETEKVHALVRRYKSPDECPFTDNLPEPLLPTWEYNWPIKKNSININKDILAIYINKIIPLISKIDDDKNYGSSKQET